MAARFTPHTGDDEFGRYNMALLATVCSGVLLLCWEHIASNAAIIIFTILFGFCSGAIVSLVSACVAQITPSPRQIGAHLGLLMFVSSFACLSGPPISGALVTRNGSYVQAGYFGGYFGGAYVFWAGVLLFGARLVGERNLRIKL